MRVLLQHAANGLYVTDSGGWTPNLAEASDFSSSLRAIGYVQQQRLSGVQVLVVFADAGVLDTVALQLPAATGLLPAA